ncbi:MAG: hypothetical protein II680_13520 [Clostridia bacterium]|nr:hypothetical protein [Clostridia bacterium]
MADGFFRFRILPDARTIGKLWQKTAARGSSFEHGPEHMFPAYPNRFGSG